MCFFYFQILIEIRRSAIFVFLLLSNFNQNQKSKALHHTWGSSKTWNQLVWVVATPVPFFIWNCLNKYSKIHLKKITNIREKYLKILPERESAGRWRRRRLWRLLLDVLWPEFRPQDRRRSSSGQFCSVGSVTAERWERGDAREQIVGTFFLGPFWLEDLFGGGSEHVSGGMWKSISWPQLHLWKAFSGFLSTLVTTGETMVKHCR